MKPQDILFLISLFVLLWRGNPRGFVWAGLACLLISIPLFHLWIFFTAERLVWYSMVFFFIAIGLLVFKKS